MDVCVEAVGHPESLLNCIEAVAFGGKIILIGNGKKEVTFNHSILVKKELNIYGSRNSLNAFEPLIELVSSGEVDIDNVVTDVFALDEVVDAFNLLTHNDGTHLKVMVKFD